MATGLMIAGSASSCSEDDVIVCPCEPEVCETDCQIEHDHLLKRTESNSHEWDCPACGMG